MSSALKKIKLNIVKNLNLYKYGILLALLFVSCFSTIFSWIAFAYCLCWCIFMSFEENLKLICFTFSLENIFKTSVFDHLYLLMTFAITIVLGVKYLYECFKKKNKVNYILLSLMLLFLIYLLLPMHEIALINWLRYAATLALIYLIYEKRKDISFKNIAQFFIYGLIVSIFFGLFRSLSPRLQAIVPDMIPYIGSSKIRFCGAFDHPNDLASNGLFAICLLFIFAYNKSVRNYKLIIEFIIIFVACYLSMSRGFLVAFGVEFFVFITLYIYKYKRKSIFLSLVLLITIGISMSAMLSTTKIYFTRFENESDTKNALNVTYDDVKQNDKNSTNNDFKEWWTSVYNGETHYDPGRINIYKFYLYDVFASPQHALFGRGASAPFIGKMSAHNEFLQLLWYHGIFGLLLIALIVVDMLKWRNFNKIAILKSIIFIFAYIPIFLFESAYILQNEILLLLFILLNSSADDAPVVNNIARKKLLFFTPEYSENTGGLKYNKEVIDYIKANTRIDVHIEQDVDYGAANGMRWFKAIVKYRKLFKTFQEYDIVVIDASKYKQLYLHIRKIKEYCQNTKFICIHHHYDYETKTGISHVLCKFMEVDFLKQMDVIVYASQFTYDLGLQLLGNSLKHVLIKVPVKRAIEVKKEWNGNVFSTIGGTGYGKRKGHIELMTSLSLCKNELKNFNLKIVGNYNPNEKNFIEVANLINKYNLNKNIKYTGRISEQEKNLVLLNSKFYVFPSQYEGYGLSMLEAMSVGLPVVAFNKSAMKTIIKNGYNGYLCNNVEEFAKCISQLYNNNELCKELGLNAIQYVNTCQTTEDFIRELNLFVKNFIEGENI